MTSTNSKSLRSLAKELFRWTLSKRQGIVSGLVLIGASVGGFYGYRVLVQSDVFAISEITVHGDRAESVRSTKERLSSLIGNNSYRLNLDDINGLVEADPWVKGSISTRHHRDKLDVEIKTHVAKAAVQLGGLYLINQEGEIFKRSQSGDPELEGLTIISGIGRRNALANEEETQDKLRHALAILEIYSKDQNRPRLSEIVVSTERGLTVTTYDAATEIQLGVGDLETLEKRISIFDKAWQALPEDDQMAVRMMRVASDSSQVTVAFNEG